jgi:hypothetical protein
MQISFRQSVSARITVHTAGCEAFAPAALCALAARLAAISAGVAVSEIVSCDRTSRRVSTARQIGIYLAHVTAGLPLVTVAGHFRRDRTTAAHACRLIEDRRDDEKFDAELNGLEELLREFCGAAR